MSYTTRLIPRTLGEVKRDYADLLRRADAIFIPATIEWE
jgi:GMP synthase PP-ATPase subunit